MYQLICHARTGSTIVSHMMKIHGQQPWIDQIGLTEYFNHKTYRIENNSLIIEPDYGRDSWDNVKRKLDFVLEQKNKQIDYSMKIFPDTLMKIAPNQNEWETFKENLYEYLEDYKILNIKRHPYNHLLSFLYQKQTAWKKTHGLQKPELTNLVANKSHIESYKNMLDNNKVFFKKLRWYRVLDYDNLIPQCEEIFDMKFEGRVMEKMKNHIDYKSLLLEKDKEIIDNLYSKWLWKYA